MRVYFLNHSAAANHLGGSELSLLALIDAWRARDPEFVPTIVSPSRRGALVEEARRRGLATFVVPFEGWALFAEPGAEPEAALRARRDFASTRRLIERLRADRPDLVVTNTVVAPWAAYAAAAVGIPHVWFVREYATADQGFHFPVGREAALRDVGRLSALVVANSEALSTSLEEHIPGDRLFASYPAIDPERVRALAQAATPPSLFPLADADLRVVVVGRLTRTKGQWRVIDAIGRLRARGVRIAVCFVGEEVEADADVLLARRAARLGVGDAVTFVGEQPNPFPYVAAADVGLTPSDREAFGRATLEYMTLGRPVIASRGGGSSELIVEGETGYLVDRDDIDALADRLETLARDPGLRERLGRASRRRADELAERGDVGRLIDQLAATAATPTPELPETVVGWLDVPAFFLPRGDGWLGVRVRIRHLGRRLAGVARHPIATLRRRWLRARRLSRAAARPSVAPPQD